MSDIKSGQELFNIIDGGDAKAFADFYRVYFKKLLVVSDKYVDDVNVAEELVQDLFLKIWEDPLLIKDVRNIAPYLKRAVSNLSLNYLNKLQKHVPLNELDAENLVVDEDTDQHTDLMGILLAEIDKLPPQCKKVFKMSRFDGLKYKVIAQQLGISERTVENHVASAVFQIKRGIETAGIASSVAYKRLLKIILIFFS